MVYAQKSYIQITGEANLSVYLDNQFKGKTTTELNGYIIQDVSAGSHKIKIVKQGYTPFEETISVKVGEVFSYTVKPFVKHAVTISEQGNSGETDKQVEARTGKLILQSVPIQIKITMPSIEGVKNLQKTKDEWVVNDIQVGTWDIEMSFGGKTIKKQIVVTENDVTKVFVNMLSGEFSSSIVMSPEKIRARNVAYFKSAFSKYGIKHNLSLMQFYNQVPGSQAIARYKEGDNTVWISVPEKAILKNPSLTPGPRFIGYGRQTGVTSYYYSLKLFTDYSAALKFYNEQVEELKRNIDLNYLYVSNSNPLDVSYEAQANGQRFIIGYQLNTVGKTNYDVIIRFGMY